MAMSQKEKSMLEDALSKIEITSALHWTKGADPDIAIPAKKDEITEGWLFHTSSKKAVESWSSSSNHGDMPFLSKYDTQYKKGSALFSTKSKALMALRHAVEEQAAKDLLEIDKKISEAITEEKDCLMARYGVKK